MSDAAFQKHRLDRISELARTHGLPLAAGMVNTYNHVIFCNGDHSKPLGGPMCCCLNYFKLKKEANDIKDEYYKAHKVCPECQGIHIAQTYAGFIMNMSSPETYKDENKASCDECGWVGTVDNLK